MTGKDVYGAAFAPDGALYAVGYDGFLRHYSPNLELMGRIVTMGGKLPISVAIDPAGHRVAISYFDTSAVEIYDASDLHRLVVANTKAPGSGGFFHIAWSSDGKRLYAGGTFKDQLYRRRIFTFRPEGDRLGPDWPVADNTITSLAPCDDGMAFGTATATFGVVPPDDPPHIFLNTHLIDMRAKRRDRFTASADGSQLRFDLELDLDSAVQFDVARATFAGSPRRPPDQVEPDTTGLPVTGWQDAAEPRLSGKPISLGYKDARSYAVAVRPDRAGFVLGSSSALSAYAASGANRWTVWGPGAAFGVNLVRGGDLVVAAYDDGTFRWYRWFDGGELLAVFIDKKTGEWVAWMPSGHYAVSCGGKDLFGWQLDRGPSQAAEFILSSKFRFEHERPDIVQRILGTLDQRLAIKQADATRSKR